LAPCAKASRLAISSKAALDTAQAICLMKLRRDSYTARGVISEENGKSMPLGLRLISMAAPEKVIICTLHQFSRAVHATFRAKIKLLFYNLP
jgi:hypothetical protein